MCWLMMYGVCVCEKGGKKWNGGGEVASIDTDEAKVCPKRGLGDDT